MLESPVSLLSSVSARVRGSMQSDSRGHFHRVTFRAMSTPVNLAFVAPSAKAAEEFPRTAMEWIAQFEARYSRFLPESIVGQINSQAGGDWIELDEQADELIHLCTEMYDLTSGALDASALPLLRIWDWKAHLPRVPDRAAIDAALALCGWTKVQRRERAIRLPLPGMGIDLGGIGKEYAVDQIIALAREFEIADAMIDIGQDIRVIGHPPGKDAWYIGLEEPDHPGECWSAVRITNHAVATSGDYIRSFTIDGRRYGHILDPRTGIPVSSDCQAVSVIAEDCVTAGVLSTAAFILGAEDGLNLVRRQPGAEACITTHTARHQTRRFSSYVPA